MKNVLLSFSLLALFACGSMPKADSAAWREQNRAQFVQLLERHDVKDAAPYALIFDGSESGDQVLLAQFHLFSCQPDDAQDFIERIPNENEKHLFEAVLLGLVSEEDHSIATPSRLAADDEDDLPALGKNEVAVTLQPGDEIWQDEWKDIDSGNTNCIMPRIKDPTMRKLARDQAKELFESLTLEDYFRDFTVVTLALQTEAQMKYRKELLEHYRNLAGNSDYQKLAQIIAPTPEHTEKVHVVAMNQHKTEVSLSSLELSVDLPDLRPQSIPLLLKTGGQP